MRKCLQLFQGRASVAKRHRNPLSPDVQTLRSRKARRLRRYSSVNHAYNYKSIVLLRHNHLCQRKKKLPTLVWVSTVVDLDRRKEDVLKGDYLERWILLRRELFCLTWDDFWQLFPKNYSTGWASVYGKPSRLQVSL